MAAAAPSADLRELARGAPSLFDLDRELAERSLAEFIRGPAGDGEAGAWGIVEPGTPLLWSWHLDAIVEHLEAVSRGEIRRLLVNVPPRCMKSLTTSVFWPAWRWARKPDVRWLFASYAQTLSVRDSLKCRRLVESPWYQARWGGRFRLTSDQNQKMRFETDATGVRLATSVDGAATGEGGDVIVCDDPHNVREAESQAKREAVLVWWDEVMSSRLNDPATGAKVIIMQRAHERDLSGHVLEKGGYEHLVLPMEHEVKRACRTAIGWRDPRTEEGELLWPERFPAHVVEGMKGELGPYGSAGQLQQRPAPREGGMFRVDRLRVVPSVPVERKRSVRYWDKAGTAGGGKRTAGVLLSELVDGTWAIEDVVKGQWSAGERERTIRATAEADGKRVHVYVEQEPGSGGKESAEATVRNLAGFVARADHPSGDKATRAEPFAVQVESGNVLLVRGEWNRDLVEELRSFPAGRFVDQVDAAAGAFNRLAHSGPGFLMA